MAWTYSETVPAAVESPVPVNDAVQVVELGRKVLARFDRDGLEGGGKAEKDFSAFVKSLYGAGFVMTDFDGPLFDRGPMQLLFAPGLASVVAQAANVMTLRMFMHTLARGHRATYAGSGYPYFDRAYRSGGLRALIDRLDQ